MKRALSLALTVLVATTGMPPIAKAQSPDRSTVGVGRQSAQEGPILKAGLLEAARGTLVTDATRQSKAASALREAALKIPLGKKVKIVTTAGRRVKGILRAADERHLVIFSPPKRNPHGELVPQSATTFDITYEEMKSIEVDKGMRPGVKAAVIIGAAVAVLAGMVFAWYLMESE